MGYSVELRVGNTVGFRVRNNIRLTIGNSVGQRVGYNF